MMKQEKQMAKMVEKAGNGAAVTEEQLATINRYTRRPLTGEEVFVFSVILCDNEIDRDFEQFPRDSLEVLARLYQGKTGVFDHNPKAANQSARIFATELIRGEGRNSVGEDYYYLKAWAYMVRTPKTEELILEIDAGIKKEVSVGCAVEKAACSVCGADQKKDGCSHQKGETYGEVLCRHLLLNPTDAYEWSFVAVPAQKNAGVVKGRAKGHSAGGAGAWQGEVTLEKLFAPGAEAAPYDSEAVSLNKSQRAALAREYEALKDFAKAGREYYEGLRKEAVRLALLSQPELDPAVMAAVAKKMDVVQMREFVRVFGQAAARRFPIGVRTQLVQDNSGDNKDGEKAADSFLI